MLSYKIRTNRPLNSALALMASLAIIHSAHATDLNGTFTNSNQTITDDIISTGFTWTAGTLIIGGSSTSNVTGLMTFNSGSNLYFGETGSSQTVNGTNLTSDTASLFIRSGTLNVSGSFSLNSSDTYTQTGGSLTASTMTFANSGTSSVSTLHISAGTLSTAGIANLAVRGTTTVNLSGSGAFTANTLNMSTNLLASGTATSTFNLNGGTLTAGQIIKGTGGSTGTQTFNFNGGTLRASANQAAYMTGLTNAFVKVGGAIINTNGFSVTIGQNLLADAVFTGGGLTKQGSGTLTLTGDNTYTGGTTVSAGTLATSTTGNFGTGNITVQSGTLTLGNSTSIANGATLFFNRNTTTNINLSSGIETLFTITETISGTTIYAPGTYSAADLNTRFGLSGIFTGSGSITTTAIPEPSSYAALAGIAGLALVAVRRRRHA